MPRPMTPIREAKEINETLIRLLHIHAVNDQAIYETSYALTMAEETTLRFLRRQREVLNRIDAGRSQ